MATSDPFRDLVPFVAVADTASFIAAARRLGIDPSAVSRAIARLERSIGVRLVHRTSRSVRLSPEGIVFAQQCRAALDSIEQARATIASALNVPSGLLRATAPQSFGRAVLVPALPKLLARHPEMRVELELTDRQVDLVHENFEAAIRIGPLDDSSLVVRTLGPSRFVTVASPAYLRRAGRPKAREALLRHRCIRYRTRDGAVRPWLFASDDARAPIELDVPAVLILDGPSVVDAAIAGAGIAHIPDYLARSPVHTGALSVVFDDGADAGTIQHVHPAARYPSARVRAFMAFVAELVTPPPRRRPITA